MFLGRIVDCENPPSGLAIIMFILLLPSGIGVDEDLVSIAAGKDFAFVRTASGKVRLHY